MRMASLRRATSGVLPLAAVLLIGASAATAQESQSAAPADQVTLPPLRVTADSWPSILPPPSSSAATKTDTPIIETPQSISIVPRAFIEATGAQTMPQAVRYNAGITTGAFGFDPRFDQIYIRGFPVTTFGDYRDGLRQPFSAGLLGIRTEPYGLDRIAIIRGPSSVLYGQGPAGGLIDRISRMPGETAGGEVIATIGNNDVYQGAFDLGGPVDPEGRVLYRLTGLARDAGSEIPGAPDNRLFFAPAVTFRLDPDTTLTLLGLIQQDESIASAAYYTRPGGRATRIRTDDPAFARFLQNQQQLGYRFEHRAAEWLTVRQNLRYSHADLSAGYLYGTGTSANGRYVSRGSAWLEESLEALGVDSQAEFRFMAGPFANTLLAGLDYQWQTSNFNLGFGSAPTLDLNNPVYGLFVPRPALTTRSRQTLNQIGLYVQDQIRIAENWIVTAGLRHDWTKTESLNRVTGLSTVQDPSALTGRIGLVWLAPGGFAPYVNYSQSFQPTLGIDRAGNAFDPVRGEQIEGGLRYQLPDGQGMVTASLFQITVQNGLATDPLNTAFQIQAGEQQSRGVELEASVNVAPGFDILASYTWQDVETTRGNPAEVGKRPVGIPEHLATIWANYRLPETILPGLRLGIGVRYTGPSYANVANTVSNDGYVMLDASIGYEIGPWRATLSGTNLTDEQATICQPGICYWAQGRTVLGSIGYRF